MSGPSDNINTWGDNHYGQLGDNTVSSRSTPDSVYGVLSATAISAGAGSEFCLSVRPDGSVMAWGRNETGQLGDNTETARSTPVSVHGISTAVTVAAAHRHSLAALSDGSVMAWGRNSHGGLGDNTTDDRSTPVSVHGISTAIAVAAGMDCSFALLVDGSVRSWGLNSHGQLGYGVTGLGTHKSTPVSVLNITNAIDIQAGGKGETESSHALALLSDGSIRSWGLNESGQLGNGQKFINNSKNSPVSVLGITNATAISAGGSHSLAVLSDGSVRAWGHNQYGQVGDNSTGDGTYSERNPVSVVGISNAVDVGSGRYHSMAVLSDNSIKAWGANGSLQLGDGTTAKRSTPVSVLGSSGATEVDGGAQHSLCIGD